MKLIIAGSTGFVGTEVIHQSLLSPSITSLICLARRETPLPQSVLDNGIDASKMKSVICDDFENYSEEVRGELEGADACIWLIAITPSKLSTLPFPEVKKICQDYTIAGLKTMRPLANTPFRFIYVSGAKTDRDSEKKPWILGDYGLMRGKTERLVLEYAKSSEGKVQPCIAKPGLIDTPGKWGLLQQIGITIFRTIIGLPKVDLRDVAATLLEQAINGIEKETLENEDLARIGGPLAGKDRETEG